MSMAPLREAFEAWYAEQLQSERDWFAKSDKGSYIYPGVQTAWVAWCAGADWHGHKEQAGEGLTSDSLLAPHIVNLRIRNCLEIEGIKTVGDLEELSRVDLLRMPHMGRQAVDWLESFLAKHGRELRPET